MQSCKLRPHHGLCIRFFENKGYSDGFTRNMAEVIRFLEDNDPVITVSAGEDCICSCCPELSGGRCEASGRAALYDSRVMEICGISAGQHIRWREFQSIIADRITGCGRLPEICGDCRWYSICGHKNKGR